MFRRVAAVGLLILLIFTETKSQSNIDSVITVSQRNDSTGAAALIHLAILYKDSVPDKSLELLHEASLRLRSLDIPLQKFNCYNELGTVYSRLGNYNMASLYYDTTLSLAASVDSNRYARLLGNVGNFHIRAGELEKALKFHLKSKALKLKLRDEQGAISNCHSIATIYKNLKQPELGLKYAREGLQIVLSSEKPNPRYLHGFYSALAALYRTMNRFDSAHYYYDKCLEINTPPTIRGQLYNSIATTYVYEGKSEEALKFFKKSLAIAEELHNIIGISTNEQQIGQVLYDLGRYKEALAHVQNSITYFEQTNSKLMLMDAYSTLANIYRKLGRNDEAFDYLIKHNEIKDSTYGVQMQEQIAKMQAEFDLEKKEQENKLLVKQQEADQLSIKKKNLEIKKQQDRNMFMTAGGIMLVLLLGGSLYAYRKSKQANNIIKQQKTEVETQRDLVEEKNKEITDSINYAKRIQAAILPPENTIKEALKDVFILYKPKDIVAGDFYWLHQGKDGTYFAAADCTGHGVPGAMVSVICNSGLNRSLKEYHLTSPAKILDQTRKLVIAEFEKSEEMVQDGMDIALCKLQEKHLTYAGAHNPLWIIRKDGKEVEEIKADKQPVGKFHQTQPFTEHTVDLQQGDTIYVFSDGFADQFGGEKGKKFKASGLKSLLLSVQHKPMSKQKDDLDEAFEAWRNDLDQLDDVCLIGVRI